MLAVAAVPVHIDDGAYTDRSFELLVYLCRLVAVDAAIFTILIEVSKHLKRSSLLWRCLCVGYGLICIAIVAAAHSQV